ncbi:hypothetical protein BGZ75_002245, partial [Mortierella antarctica]
MANVPPAIEVLKKNFVGIHPDEATSALPALDTVDRERLAAFKRSLAEGMEEKIKFRLEAMASSFFHPYHKKLGHLRYSRRLDVHRYIKELLRELPEEEDEADQVVDEGDAQGFASWIHGFEGGLLLLDPELADQSIDGELPEGDYDGEEEFKKYCAEHIVASASQKTLSVLRDPLGWWCVNKQRYPRLAVLARRFLAIPGTSVPSEQLFSDA